MFQTLDGFLQLWKSEAESTQKVLNQLTDESLSQEITSQNWTLGRIGWHIVTAIGVMTAPTGLSYDSPKEDFPVPTSAKYISDSYQQVGSDFINAIKNQWTDENLGEVIDFFGRKMTNSELLFFVIQHQTHHRGQMTVLMRQAGLSVPGLYGPSKEEWANIGMEPPKM